MRSLSVPLVVGLVVVAVAGCSGPVNSITQRQVRQLHTGMSTAEVETLLGPPVSTLTDYDGGWPKHSDGADLLWDYTGNGPKDVFRGIRLMMEFSHGRLVYAYAYRKPLYNASTRLFTLDPDGRMVEGNEFANWFRP